MQFAFTSQQEEFRTAVRQMLEKECAPAALRATWDAPTGHSEQRWTRLAEMGVLGLTVPESHGGMGMDEVDLVGLLEESGRAALPEPLLETTALVAPLLASVPENGLAQSHRAAVWSEAIASGGAIATVGLSDLSTVAHAQHADLFILDHDGSTTTGEREVHAVPKERLTVTARPSLDPLRKLGRVEWQPSAETLLLAGGPAVEAISLTVDRAVAATAAVLVGLADRMISIAVAYATDRKQFGRPIGSYQAVAHPLASAYVKLEHARPAVYRAAWSIARREPTRSRDASMAKALASEAAVFAARTALQTHGAIGYTWECDLQLWLKRTWALAAAWGDAAAHRERMLRFVLAGQA